MQLTYPVSEQRSSGALPVVHLPGAASLDGSERVVIITGSGDSAATKSALVSDLTGAGNTGGTGGRVGTGTPEAVVTAPPGTPYYDTDTDNMWYKATGVGNTGWRQLTAI